MVRKAPLGVKLKNAGHGNIGLPWHTFLRHCSLPLIEVIAMELITPNYSLKAKFTEFAHDYLRHDIIHGGGYIQALNDFNQYVATLLASPTLADSAEQTPCSHYWLMNDDAKLVGTMRIRHQLKNEFLARECGHIGYDVAPSFRNHGYAQAMLRLSFAKIRELGLYRILITADETNIASRKVIEACGGVLEQIIFGEVFQRRIARYWLSL